MKKLLPYGLLLGGAVVLTWALRKINTYGSIVPDLIGVELKFQNLLPVVFLKFRIVNTAELPVKLTAIVGNLYMNGNLLGQANTTQIIDIAAGQTGYVNINFQPNISGVVQQITDLYKIAEGSYNASVKFTFDGYVTVAGVPVPVKLTYNLL